jgi:hypothetical protein
VELKKKACQRAILAGKMAKNNQEMEVLRAEKK